jgi:myo-inositol-1(or 4)-monophosphatase
MGKEADIHVMTIAAEKAAVSIVRDFGELARLQNSRKSFKNFVTAADVRTEERLVFELSKMRPGFSFLCEESGKKEGESPDSTWIIDPIDGTSNFMRGIPYFAINIALMKSGVIIAGLTLNPMSGNCFMATQGSGAFLGRHNRLRVSGREEINESMIAMHASPDVELKIGTSGAIARRTGSVSVDLAYLSAGKYDAVVAKHVNLWDIASGIILIKEAGGFVEYNEIKPGVFDILAASSKIMLSKVASLTDIHSTIP